MDRLIFVLFTGAFWLGISVPVGAEEDLLLKGKTDTAIKMLHFPLSLAVVQNRPEKGKYFFYHGEQKKFNDELQGAPDKAGDEFDLIFSDRKMIKKILVSFDATRIAPGNQEEDFRGEVTRNRLKELAKSNRKALILVFRRDIRVHSEKPLPDSAFLNPCRLLAPGLGIPYTLNINTRGLIYLAKQNKVLALSPNVVEEKFFAAENANSDEQIRERLKAMVKKGLKNLAATAQKEVRSKQFEKRQSNY